MPFGPDCQYQDFNECVRRNADRDNPDAYCGAIQRRTEEHCMSAETLTEKRSRAGKLGALARWGNRNGKPGGTDGIFATDGRPRLRAVRPVARANPHWYRIGNVAEDHVLIDIYDEIGFLGVTAQEFVKELRAVKASRIELHINSPGGDVFDAIAIYNALRHHDAAVHTVVDSLAASAASFIAMAGEKITATRNAMMMIHDAVGLSIGNAADMREMADLLDKHSDNIASIYAERAGGPVEYWRGRMAEETWYTADEAYQAGLVDEVEGESEGSPNNAWDLSVFRYAGRGQAPDPTGPVDTASPTHHTDTVDRAWDKGPNEKRLPSPMPVATAKRAYGYYDAGRVEDGQIIKDACKLLHHEVSADGSPGAANLSACRNALARLPGSDVPESEHSAVQSHMNAHLDDGGRGQDLSESSNQDRAATRRDYVGDTASWYLPIPTRKENHAWMP
jgi:ATP-dependent Clp endopeptidase proteolytic subunit ClpP